MKKLILLIFCIVFSVQMNSQIGGNSPTIFNNGIKLPNIVEGEVTDSIVSVDENGLFRYVPKTSLAPPGYQGIEEGGTLGDNSYYLALGDFSYSNNGNNIIVDDGGGFSLEGIALNSSKRIIIASAQDSEGGIIFTANSPSQFEFHGTNLTSSRAYEMPNANGTLALTSNIPSTPSLSAVTAVGGTTSTNLNLSGKNGFNKASPVELIDAVSTQAGANGGIKSQYTWTAGEISRVQFGGQNILSELGVPAGATKGNLLDYFGAGSRAGFRAYMVNGNFGTVNPSLGDFAFSAGVTNLAGTNFANINAVPQGTGYDILTRVQSAEGDVASVNVRQHGLGSPHALEATIHNIVHNSEGNNASVRITPHYVESSNLQRLSSYGDGTFVESYSHTDNSTKTGTAETVIGAATYSLGIDADGNVMELPLGGGGYEGISETGAFGDFNYHLILGNPDAVNLVISDSLYNISTGYDLTVDGGQLRTTEGKIYIGSIGSQGVLNMQGNTGNRNYTFPDWSGTVQLNHKVGMLADADYTLLETDNQRKIFEMNATAPRTFTIPQATVLNYAFGFADGFKLINKGSANITITTSGSASLLGGDFVLVPGKIVTVYNYNGSGLGDNWVVED